MGTLYLVQTGRTIWEEQQRLESAAGAPLTEEGVRHVLKVAQQLTGLNIAVIHAGETPAERETAELVAKTISAKVRTSPALRELDFGLWQGLAIEEIRRRQPRMYRQWTESPASCSAPKGEPIAEACKRIRRALKRILRRQRGAAVMVVLRPFVLGLTRRILQGRAIEDLWESTDPGFEWCSFEVEEGAI